MTRLIFCISFLVMLEHFDSSYILHHHFGIDNSFAGNLRMQILSANFYLALCYRFHFSVIFCRFYLLALIFMRCPSYIFTSSLFAPSSKPSFIEYPVEGDLVVQILSVSFNLHVVSWPQFKSSFCVAPLSWVFGTLLSSISFLNTI